MVFSEVLLLVCVCSVVVVQVAGSVDTRSSPETKGADEVSFFAADAELSSTRPLQVKGFGKHGLTADPQVPWFGTGVSHPKMNRISTREVKPRVWGSRFVTHSQVS